jgi:Ca-activated chloride channel family protein
VNAATPWLLWLAGLALPAVIALHVYDRRRRRQLMAALGEGAVLAQVLATASPGRRLVKDVLLGLALTCLLIGAARPRIVGDRQVELHGLDVVVAVDVSKSMLTDDVAATEEMTARKLEPSRLGRARELAAAVIDGLPGDRIAPVVFAGAVARYPLTEDREVAARFLYDLGPNELPGGSNLAEVLRVGRCLLRPEQFAEKRCADIRRRGHGGDPLPGESLDPPQAPVAAGGVLEEKSERGRAIVLFTDGGDPRAVEEEVGRAKEAGIAIIVVGVGSEQGGLVREPGVTTTYVKRDKSGQTITTKREDAALRALAAAAGDAERYVIDQPRGEVDPDPVIAALAKVQRGLSTKRVRDLREAHPPFVFAGLMLLVIEAALAGRRRRRHPEVAA